MKENNEAYMQGYNEAKKHYKILSLDDIKDLPCVRCKHCVSNLDNDDFFCTGYVQYENMIKLKDSTDCKNFDEFIPDSEDDSPCCSCVYLDSTHEEYGDCVNCSKNHNEFVLTKWGCDDYK